MTTWELCHIRVATPSLVSSLWLATLSREALCRLLSGTSPGFQGPGCPGRGEAWAERSPFRTWIFPRSQVEPVRFLPFLGPPSEVCLPPILRSNCPSAQGWDRLWHLASWGGIGDPGDVTGLTLTEGLGCLYGGRGA